MGRDGPTLKLDHPGRARQAAPMTAILPFPDISPEIFTLSLGGFEFALRWYALAYLAAILGGWLLARLALSRTTWWPGDAAPMDRAQLEDVMTWATLGVVIGGRLGYVLFYQPAYFLENPAEIPAVWQGGMSFHGGMIGTGLAVIAFALRHGVPIRSLLDLAALAAPLGLGLGRLANFVNAELWGRPWDGPWAVIFPTAAAQTCRNVGDLCARHPSQLYEAILEGAVLLAVLWLLAARGWLKRPGVICGAFLAGYGAARIFVEHFRQADAQYITPDNPLGHVIRLGEAGLSMGQVLSLPMLAIGLGAAVLAVRAGRTAPAAR